MCIYHHVYCSDKLYNIFSQLFHIGGFLNPRLQLIRGQTFEGKHFKHAPLQFLTYKEEMRVLRVSSLKDLTVEQSFQ